MPTVSKKCSSKPLPLMAFLTNYNNIKQTTPLFDDERVIITHPFHPNTAKEYKLVGINKSHGREKLLCKNADNTEVLIPIEYTNMAQKENYINHEEMNCDFRYDDLIMLLDIIKNINVK
jgi:hypothetical protein